MDPLIFALGLVIGVLAALPSLVRGFPDWYRRPDIPLVTTYAAFSSATVEPGSSVTLHEVTGRRGVLKGFIMRYEGLPTTVIAWIEIWIDGKKVVEDSCAGWLSFFTDGAGGMHPSFARPVSLIFADTTNGYYAFSWTEPLSFSSSLKIVVRNDGADVFYVSFRDVVEVLVTEA